MKRSQVKAMWTNVNKKGTCNMCSNHTPNSYPTGYGDVHCKSCFTSEQKANEKLRKRIGTQKYWLKDEKINGTYPNMVMKIKTHHNE
tara:strand:- start:45 stop:305 length:261 start_codon:yes stop_codon:yes gene_type:complete